MELVELFLQLDEILLVHQGLDDLVPRHVLLVHEILHQPVTGDEVHHLADVFFRLFGGAGLARFGHGAAL